MFEILITLFIIITSLYGYVVYGVDTKRKRLRPRAATWLIWAILSTCVATLQIEYGAGLGAVVTVMAVGANFILAGMAWYYGHRTIHSIDVFSSIAAVGVLVLWLTAGDAVTVVFAALSYLFGFLPTFERAYRKPFAENITPFATNTLKYALSLMVIANFSVETVLYPAILAIFNGVFLAMVLWRRAHKKSRKKPLAKKHSTRYSSLK